MKDIRNKYREIVNQVSPEIKEGINLLFASTSRIHNTLILKQTCLLRG